MAKLSKKTIRAIEFCSVYDDVIRQYHTTSQGCFVDNPPEEWGKYQREIFDMASEVEDRVKAAILKILGVENSSEAEKRPH